MYFDSVQRKILKGQHFFDKSDERAKPRLSDLNSFICLSLLRYGVHMGKFCSIEWWKDGTFRLGMVFRYFLKSCSLFS
jgi:hypothetical protein